MNHEIASHEDVTRTVSEIMSRAEELERVAGYLGDEAREIRRLVSGPWDLAVPVSLLEEIGQATDLLSDAIQQAHTLWNDGIRIKNIVS